MTTKPRSLVVLAKRLDCKCGVSLLPNKVYEADWDSEFNRWIVSLSETVKVVVLPKNVKESLTSE